MFFIIFFFFIYFNVNDNKITDNYLNHDQDRSNGTGIILTKTNFIVFLSRIIKEITEVRSISLTFITGMGVTLGYFYMSSLLEQLLSVSNDFETSSLYLNIFSIMLPVESLPETFVVSYFLHRFKSVHIRYRLLCIMACIWVMLSLIHIPVVQLLTFTIFILWRITTFASLYACVTSQIEMNHQVEGQLKILQKKSNDINNENICEKISFNKFSDENINIDAWGSRTGLSLTFGGLMAFTVIPLNKIVINQLGGNFMIVNLFLLGMYVISYFFVEYAFNYYRTADEKTLRSLITN